MGMLANVYRCIDKRLGDGSVILEDCTNNGWSAKYDTVCIVNVDGPFEPDDRHPAVRLVRHPSPNVTHVFAVSDSHLGKGLWTMFGGNFLYTSDSRFAASVRELLGQPESFVGAVPIHDRIENY